MIHYRILSILLLCICATSLKAADPTVTSFSAICRYTTLTQQQFVSAAAVGNGDAGQTLIVSLWIRNELAEVENIRVEAFTIPANGAWAWIGSGFPNQAISPYGYDVWLEFRDPVTNQIVMTTEEKYVLVPENELAIMADTKGTLTTDLPFCVECQRLEPAGRAFEIAGAGTCRRFYLGQANGIRTSSAVVHRALDDSGRVGGRCRS